MAHSSKSTQSSSSSAKNARAFISPSDLTFAWDGCHRCLWLKYNHGVSAPLFMPLVGELSALQEAHFDNAETQNVAPVLPAGRVRDRGGWVKSRPIEVQGQPTPYAIRGKYDLLIDFEDGSVGIIDCKFQGRDTDKSDFYAAQLEAYAFALEKRILVEKKVFDRFMGAFETAVKNFRVEDPNLASAEMGPLISKKQFESVSTYLDENVAFTGSKPNGKGYWVAPHVLTPKSTQDRSWREEIFGPVVSVMPFDDEADAIVKANDTEYGLSGSIWTNDVGKAIRVSRGIETGNLSVNSNSSVRYWTPFGGFKQSGLGRELGPDAVDAFTEVKNVFISSAE